MSRIELENKYKNFLKCTWTTESARQFSAVAMAFEDALRLLPPFSSLVRELTEIWSDGAHVFSNTWSNHTQSPSQRLGMLWIMRRLTGSSTLEWSCREIEELHKTLCPLDHRAGVLRPHPVYCWDREFMPSDLLPNMWAQFEIEVLRPVDQHPIIRAGRAFQWIKCIHPFADGNARLASLVRDGLLLQNGFLPVSGRHASEGHVGVFLNDPPSLTPVDAIFKTLHGSIQSLQLLVAKDGFQRRFYEIGSTTKESQKAAACYS